MKNHQNSLANEEKQQGKKAGQMAALRGYDHHVHSKKNLKNRNRSPAYNAGYEEGFANSVSSPEERERRKGRDAGLQAARRRYRRPSFTNTMRSPEYQKAYLKAFDEYYPSKKRKMKARGSSTAISKKKQADIYTRESNAESIYLQNSPQHSHLLGKSNLYYSIQGFIPQQEPPEGIETIEEFNHFLDTFMEKKLASQEINCLPSRSVNAVSNLEMEKEPLISSEVKRCQRPAPNSLFFSPTDLLQKTEDKDNEFALDLISTPFK